MFTAVAAPPFLHVAGFPGCCTARQALQLQLHLPAATAYAAAGAVALADRCTRLALHVSCGRQGICSKFLLALACLMARNWVFSSRISCMVRHVGITEQHSGLSCKNLYALS